MDVVRGKADSFSHIDSLLLQHLFLKRLSFLHELPGYLCQILIDTSMNLFLACEYLTVEFAFYHNSVILIATTVNLAIENYKKAHMSLISDSIVALKIQFSM